MLCTRVLLALGAITMATGMPFLETIESSGPGANVTSVLAQNTSTATMLGSLPNLNGTLLASLGNLSNDTRMEIMNDFRAVVHLMNTTVKLANESIPRPAAIENSDFESLIRLAPETEKGQLLGRFNGTFNGTFVGNFNGSFDGFLNGTFGNGTNIRSRRSVEADNGTTTVPLYTSHSRISDFDMIEKVADGENGEKGVLLGRYDGTGNRSALPLESSFQNLVLGGNANSKFVAYKVTPAPPLDEQVGEPAVLLANLTQGIPKYLEGIIPKEVLDYLSQPANKSEYDLRNILLFHFDDSHLINETLPTPPPLFSEDFKKQLEMESDWGLYLGNVKEGNYPTELRNVIPKQVLARANVTIAPSTKRNKRSAFFDVVHYSKKSGVIQYPVTTVAPLEKQVGKPAVLLARASDGIPKHLEHVLPMYVKALLKKMAKASSKGITRKPDADCTRILGSSWY